MYYKEKMMPCHEIRTINVDLKMVDKDLLKKALDNLGFTYNETENGFIIFSNKFSTRIKLDLKTGQANMAESDQKYLNKIKQEYSKAAIEKISEKRKWILKKTGNRIEARKY